MKKPRQKNVPLDLQINLQPTASLIFWNFVECIQLGTIHFERGQFIPVPSYFATNIQILEQTDVYFKNWRRKIINTIPSGTLLACVLTSSHQQFFPINTNLVEFLPTQVRTFFGHCIQIRHRVEGSNVLLRVLIAGELFLFRIFLNAPNIISFFAINTYNKNLRSSFQFKVRKTKYGLRQSRKIGSY